MKRAALWPEHSLPAHHVPPPWPGRHVRLDGTLVHVRDTPATGPGAEPALYVHGLGGSAQNWTDLAGLLADRLDGQAIDLPGFGRSEPGPRYTIPAFAERVIRWIEHSDRGPVHLFGNSLGGAISLSVSGIVFAVATRAGADAFLAVFVLALVLGALSVLTARRTEPR